MKKLIVSILFFIISFSVYSQNKFDTIQLSIYNQNKFDSIHKSIMGNPVPIYEYGAPLTSCETNFKNLFKNWNTVNVTNAHEYELLDFTFVETIADTTRYNYYRNYFSGGDAFGSSVSSSSSDRFKFKTIKGKRITEETKITERFVRPTFIYSEFFDQRGRSAEAKKILSEEFTSHARELLMREMNIDTMKLIYTAGEIFKTRKFKSHSDFGDSFEAQIGRMRYELASTDSISRKLFDILIKDGNYEGLSIEEKRALTLEEILVMRISNQLGFNKLVHFGDKVYVVRFKYHLAMYPVYVICNPTTKKVIVDSFFKKITMKTK